jgi:hypothetical protein
MPSARKQSFSSPYRNLGDDCIFDFLSGKGPIHPLTIHLLPRRDSAEKIKFAWRVVSWIPIFLKRT